MKICNNDSPEGRAAHNGSQFAEGPWCYSPGLGLPLVAPPLLACRLVEPRPNIALPVLVEVAVGDDVVPLGSHDGVCKKTTSKKVAPQERYSTINHCWLIHKSVLVWLSWSTKVGSSCKSFFTWKYILYTSIIAKLLCDIVQTENSYTGISI